MKGKNRLDIILEKCISMCTSSQLSIKQHLILESLLNEGDRLYTIASQLHYAP